MQMHEYHFDSDNVLKSVIRNPDDHSRRYGIKTYHDLETCIENRVGTICAVIDWQTKSFKIGGKLAFVSMMKRKGGAFSSVRHWRWLDSPEEYAVRYTNSTETWSVVNSDNTTLAELRSCIVSFSTTKFPVVRLSPLVRTEDERLFLLLIMLYSEARRLDREA